MEYREFMQRLADNGQVKVQDWEAGFWLVKGSDVKNITKAECTPSGNLVTEFKECTMNDLVFQFGIGDPYAWTNRQ